MVQKFSDISLPTELLDAIIDELGCSQDSDSGSRNALLDCALVCHSFHYRAAGHLFANVIVITNRRFDSNDVVMQRLEDFLQILRKNDSIGPRILSFSLDTTLSPPHPKDLDTNPANVIRSGQTLPHILRLLCSIRRFSWRNHLSQVFCKDLSLDLTDAIGSLGERTSLQSVSMQCIELGAFPIPFLFKLDHLSFSHMLLPQGDYSTPSIYQIHYSTRLREFVLHGCSEIIPWIANTPALFSQLTIFDAWMRNEDEVLLAWLVMQAAFQTLEVLNVSDISHFRYPTLIPGPIDLGILQNLRAIALSFTIATADNVVFPMCICGLLNPPTSPTRLENVEIQLKWIDCLQGSEERMLVQPGWGVLDEIISQENLHPKLASVSFKLKMGYGRRQLSLTSRSPAEIVIVRDRIVTLASKLFHRTVAARWWRPKIDIEIYRSKYVY